MSERGAVTTFLFTDIEGSTRLWEREPERMQRALAAHDALARGLVTQAHGSVVKTTGDGFYAVFDDPVDAIVAAVEMQVALLDPQATGGLPLRIRCGVHAGVREHRDDDFFGHAVNRTARIMSAGHGGQVLLSKAVVALVQERLPDKVQLRDLGLVRLKDMAQPEELYQVLHPALCEAFPPLRSLVETPNNLPQEVTSFVGRERELEEARQMLGATRVLTLLGAGGLGKTRLSIHVARAMLDSFSDGAWFVELAPIADPQRVPETVASVLGVKEDAGRPVLEAVLKFVADRQLLVILDNCEHVVQACAELARALLQAGPRVTILASSRERLHVAGERVLEVPALAVPLAREQASASAIAQCDAVRLFRDRALAAQPSFELTDANASSVAEICRRLDGIPLALELAAARVRSLSVAEIARRLDDRFRLLTGGDRTAMPRQRTLRALIDWSYDLLDERERVAFQRLAVFAGGWTLEAAEAVVAGEPIDAVDVLDLLANLVDKSLVAMELEGKRYWLPESVREYARERLTQSGEAAQAHRRHLACYAAIAEAARPGLVGPEQGAWLSRLDAERENILAAHAWALADGDAEQGLAMLCAVKFYWLNRGLLGLGYRVITDALTRVAARSALRSRGLFIAGQLACYMGRYGQGRAHLEASLAIARELGDDARTVAVLQPLGWAALGEGDLAKARSTLEEALALAQQRGDKREIVAALSLLGALNRVDGDYARAGALYRQAMALSREQQDRESIAIGLLNLGMVAIGQGLAQEARRMLLEVGEIAEEIASKPVGKAMLEVCAGLACSRSEWNECAIFFGAGDAQSSETGLQRDPADEAFLRPHVARARDALGAAEFERAYAVGAAMRYPDAMSRALRWLSAPVGAAATSEPTH